MEWFLYDRDHCYELRKTRINLAKRRGVFSGLSNIYGGAILRKYLKPVSAILYQIVIFSPNASPSRTVKNVFYFI